MNVPQAAYNKLNQSWLLLKVTYGLLFVVAGADKFTNLVVHWSKYLSPTMYQIFSSLVTRDQFMYGVSAIEIIIGVLILLVNTRIGAYLAMAWLLIIVVNLLTMGMYFDIAVRDIVMAIGALVLAWLTEVKEESKG
jgi:hypothetical protein